MKDSDFRGIVGKYFTLLDEWRRTKSDVKKAQCKSVEAKIKADNERYFKRITANKQMRIPM